MLAVPAGPNGPSEEAEAPAPVGYPLQATTFTPAVVDLLGSHNQPSLFELLGQPEGMPWQAWVEISPETARASGVDAGARVRITSPHGAVEAQAVLTEGAGLASVAIAHVPVVPGGGRWARTAAVDVRQLWPRGGPTGGWVPVRLTRV